MILSLDEKHQRSDGFYFNHGWTQWLDFEGLLLLNDEHVGVEVQVEFQDCIPCIYSGKRCVVAIEMLSNNMISDYVMNNSLHMWCVFFLIVQRRWLMVGPYGWNSSDSYYLLHWRLDLKNIELIFKTSCTFGADRLIGPPSTLSFCWRCFRRRWKRQRVVLITSSPLDVV